MVYEVLWFIIMWSSLSETCDKSVVFFGTLVSSTNKTDRHDIVEILFKVALNTITLTHKHHILLAHISKENVSFCHHLASVVSSVNFSHFNLLLRNPLAKWTETWYEASITVAKHVIKDSWIPYWNHRNNVHYLRKCVKILPN